jgi:SAM-dependent methyltransferase
MNVPDRTTFETAYAGKAPWDIGKPQPAFVEAADRVTGAVLDAGCGTGENALFFAERGRPVLGIDFLEGPIREARRKAGERGLAAEFARRDALTLTPDRRFNGVIDSGLFHAFRRTPGSLRRAFSDGLGMMTVRRVRSPLEPALEVPASA